MRLQSGIVYNLPQSHAPVSGCTVSEQVLQENGRALSVFSLAAGTGISAECYDVHKVLLMLSGEMDIWTNEAPVCSLKAGDSFVTPRTIPIGMKSARGCVYFEIGLGKDDTMNELIQAGEVFRLKDLLPYQDGRIVNMDLVSNDKMKFVLMSFDAGTGLSEHAAPGEALVFALDGEAVIGYEGQEHTLKAGQTFKFDRMGRHRVTATKPFKMALLLMLA